MAGNTTANATYVGQGPSGTLQHLALGNDPGALSQALFGFASSTGDNSALVFDVNFIDGTKTLSFTPTGILAFRTGGDQAAGTRVVSCSGATATKFTVTLSANLGAANTYNIAFIVLP